MKNKLLQKLALSAAFVTAVGGLAGCGAHYSDGNRVGTVSKFSYKGIVCKSWEGQLAMDNFVRDANGGTSNTFDFSVTDPAVVKQIQAAQDSGERVKLTYDQWLINNPCTSSTDYYITAVTPAGAPAAKAPGLK
jgi:hypothetical protein